MASATSTPVGPAASSSRSAGRRSTLTVLHTSSTSPTCQSRIQERDELRHLNDRLANYILRIQELERERSFMLLQLENKDESKSREMKRLYEEELADVRKCLDELAGDKTRLQVDYGKLCEEFKKLETRSHKKERDLVTALAKWKKTEAVLSSKESEFTKLVSENGRLHEDFTDVQGQLENAEGILTEKQNQLTSEILRRVEMENQVQTLKEQLEFQKNISEQEIFDIRSQHESRQMEVESGRHREFEGKLARAMQQLRQDHESQLQQCKVW